MTIPAGSRPLAAFRNESVSQFLAPEQRAAAQAALARFAPNSAASTTCGSPGSATRPAIFSTA